MYICITDLDPTVFAYSAITGRGYMIRILLKSLAILNTHDMDIKLQFHYKILLYSNEEFLHRSFYNSNCRKRHASVEHELLGACGIAHIGL
jgi:hypothetical protein